MNNTSAANTSAATVGMTMGSVLARERVMDPADDPADVEMESESADANQDADMSLVGSLEPTQDDEIAGMLLTQLGAGRAYARERRQAAQRFTVSEVYSPPRVTKEFREGKWKHLLPGFALDLTVVDPSDGLPWDFSRKSKREKAVALLRQQ